MFSPPHYVQMRYQNEQRQPFEENELFVLVPQLNDFLDSISDEHGQDGWNAIEAVREYIRTNTLEQ